MAEITPKEIVIKREKFDNAIESIKEYTIQAKEEATVKRQNFDELMESINDYTDCVQESASIDKVPENGGFLGKGKHKVTGKEFNSVISQIGDKFVYLGNFNLGTVDIITKICEALSALDNEHISGILTAANVAMEASYTANKSIEGVNKTVLILKNFKESLEEIKHLNDIDEAYEILEEHKVAIKVLCDYKNKMSSLKHINDIDELWEEAKSYFERISAVEEELPHMQDAQNEKLNEMANKQQSILSEFSEKQSKKLDLINSEIQSEKEKFNKQLLILTTKMRIAYIIAGSSAALSIIYIILNALGVI